MVKVVRSQVHVLFFCDQIYRSDSDRHDVLQIYNGGSNAQLLIIVIRPLRSLMPGAALASSREQAGDMQSSFRGN